MQLNKKLLEKAGIKIVKDDEKEQEAKKRSLSPMAALEDNPMENQPNLVNIKAAI